MTVQVALEALTKDAGRWHDTSSVLNEAMNMCAGLTLTDTQLSWASQDTGLQATYEEVRAKVAGLLGEGATETGSIGTSLLDVRRIYEGSDENAKNKMKGVWDIDG